MKSVSTLLLFTAGVLLLAGCTGVRAPGEKQMRDDLQSVAAKLRPDGRPPVLPHLTPESGLSNYLAFALLNSPPVAAAFYDWSASVENITVARSRPDPQLTFQAYIEDALTSLMPGLTWNFPGPGKLTARGSVAVAQSAGKYQAFESAVLQTAFNLKSAYYNLGLLAERLRINHETLSLLDRLEPTARAQIIAGQGTLPDVLRLQSDLDRVRSDRANLEDSYRLRLENFKAALGLAPGQPDPPVPAHFDMATEMAATDDWLSLALTNNPQLKAMAADVRAAEAGIALAYKERVPDFNAGLQVEVYRPPFYWPQANATLPIWRDKLAAELAQAQASKLAAESRLQTAQIELAVSFAEKSFAGRETGRNLALIENQLLPRAHQAVEISRANYRAGATDFPGLAAAERMVLDLELDAAETRTQHAIALADLSLMAAGVPPPDAPILVKNPQP